MICPYCKHKLEYVKSSMKYHCRSCKQYVDSLGLDMEGEDGY